jgi:hypothetical protein
MGEAESPATLSHSNLSEPVRKVATSVLKCVVMEVLNLEF